MDRLELQLHNRHWRHRQGGCLLCYTFLRFFKSRVFVQKKSFSGGTSISISPLAFGAFRLFYDPAKYPNTPVLTSDVLAVEFMILTTSNT
jgi:hypothetical protein